jgi:hypothetical protein
MRSTVSCVSAAIQCNKIIARKNGENILANSCTLYLKCNSLLTCLWVKRLEHSDHFPPVFVERDHLNWDRADASIAAFTT